MDGEARGTLKGPPGRCCRRLLAVLSAAGTAAFSAALPLAAGTNFWTSVGPNGGSVSTVLIGPAEPQVLYAGSTGGVFKSFDGGATWQGASRGLRDHPIAALAADPRRPRALYAVAGDTSTLVNGVWVSRDAGATWVATPLSVDNGYANDGGQEYFHSLAIDPAHRGTVLATSNYGVYVSSDGGRTWSVALQFFTVNPDAGLSIQVAAAPARSSVFAYVVGSTEDGVSPFVKLLESADGGKSWIDRSAALPADALPPLAIEPTRPGAMYLAGYWKTYRSLDGAASWQQLGPAGPPIAAGPGGVVIAGSPPSAGSVQNPSPGVFKSLDGGTTWAPVASPGYASAYAVGPSSKIYATVRGPGVMASGDGGRSWQVANLGLAATSILAAAVDPRGTGTLYIAAADAASAYYKSRNAGGRWRPLGTGGLAGAGLAVVNDGNGPFVLDGATLYVDPAQPATLYFSNGNAAARSTDAGASWTPIAGPPGYYKLSFLSVDPSSPPVLYSTSPSFVGGGGPGSCAAWKSADDGGSWSCLGLERAFRILVAPSDPSTLYAVGDLPAPRPPHLLWKSLDAGASWAPIDAGLPFVAQQPQDEPYLLVDPGNARRLLVSVPEGVWQSLDGGAHWSETDHGLPLASYQDPGVFSPLLAVDPHDPALLYAAASNIGVYRSRDGGNRWQPILAGLPPPCFVQQGTDYYEALIPDPRHSGTVYLATNGNGLLSYTAQ
jgi:photosystem II stability/assembly factor-like uncharacterized protein